MQQQQQQLEQLQQQQRQITSEQSAQRNQISTRSTDVAGVVAGQADMKTTLNQIRDAVLAPKQQPPQHHQQHAPLPEKEKATQQRRSEMHAMR